MTRPSSSQTPVTQNEAVKNESFLQVSLGEISPTEQQQSQLSSVIGGITPQNTSLTPAQDGQNVNVNVTESVSHILFELFYFIAVANVLIPYTFNYVLR